MRREQINNSDSSSEGDKLEAKLNTLYKGYKPEHNYITILTDH